MKGRKKANAFNFGLPSVIASHLLSKVAFAISIDTSDVPSLGKRIELSDFADQISRFKELAAVAVGICAMTALLMFIVSITRLSASAGNDMQRRKAIMSILMTGIALTLFGSASVVIAVFWNMFE